MNTQAERSRRFSTRVQIERRVLGAVNAVFLDGDPLGALSVPAIDSWLEQRQKYPNPERIIEIHLLLRTVSERLRIGADNSRETVDIDGADYSQTDLLVCNIVTICNGLRGTAN